MALAVRACGLLLYFLILPNINKMLVVFLRLGAHCASPVHKRDIFDSLRRQLYIHFTLVEITSVDLILLFEFLLHRTPIKETELMKICLELCIVVNLSVMPIQEQELGLLQIDIKAVVKYFFFFALLITNRTFFIRVTFEVESNSIEIFGV